MQVPQTRSITMCFRETSPEPVVNSSEFEPIVCGSITTSQQVSGGSPLFVEVFYVPARIWPTLLETPRAGNPAIVGVYQRQLLSFARFPQYSAMLPTSSLRAQSTAHILDSSNRAGSCRNRRPRLQKTRPRLSIFVDSPDSRGASWRTTQLPTPASHEISSAIFIGSFFRTLEAHPRGAFRFYEVHIMNARTCS